MIQATVFFVFCPGNRVRLDKSIKLFFPDFNKLSFLRKFEIGYSASGNRIFFTGTLPMLFFFAVILFAVCVMRKNRYTRIMATIPFLTVLSFFFYTWIVDVIKVSEISANSQFGQFLAKFSRLGTGINLVHPLTWIPDLLITLLILFTSFSVWELFSNFEESLLAVLVLAMGYCSKIILAFSPTIGWT